jgi:hypothetical protein
MLDVFALLVLLVLLIAIVAGIGVLGALPGIIARKRKHPQSDAISVGGWVGLFFGGVLWPLILIWAYTTPGRSSVAEAISRKGDSQ